MIPRSRVALLSLLLACMAAGVVVIFAIVRPAQDAPAGCDRGNGRIKLAEGFCASVFADGVGALRHIAIDAQGNLYARLSREKDGGTIAALRDEDGDGKADRTAYFGGSSGSGIAVADGWLYFSTNSEVLRWRLPPGELVPQGEPETLVAGFPPPTGHGAKPFALDGAGGLYVTVGSPSNSCQQEDRGDGSPGLDPCPQREQYAAVWRFKADVTGQDFATGERYAAGIRNAMALAWNPDADALFAVQHGRDQLAESWPDRFTREQGAELPAEEMQRLDRGADFGWPYCYYDQIQGRRVLAPEYGGDGKEIGRCADFTAPVAAYPGHYAPNALLFYSGDAFGPAYRGGAFIAFHGSWNRRPVQGGFLVAFQPFADGRPSGEWQIFADGFAGKELPGNPDDARYRPMGLAEGPDGSLYIADSARGRIWRVKRVPQ